MATHIKNGHYSKIIEDMETFLSAIVEKAERIVKDKSIEIIQKQSQRRTFRELGEEHDAIRDFEHIRVSMKRKKERLNEIKTLQHLTEEHIRKH